MPFNETLTQESREAVNRSSQLLPRIFRKFVLSCPEASDQLTPDGELKNPLDEQKVDSNPFYRVFLDICFQKELRRCVAEHEAQTISAIGLYHKIVSAIRTAVGGDLTEGRLREWDRASCEEQKGPLSKNDWIERVLPWCKRQVLPSGEPA